MNIYEKLMKVQSTLKAPKNQYNDFGKYNYRSCEDILEGLKPLLAEVKAIVTLSDAIQQIGDRYYLVATATFVDVETAEKIEATAQAREDESKKGMDLAQVTGSVSSYARKYALNGLFCIDDTKDVDSLNGSQEPKTGTQGNKSGSNSNNKPNTETGGKNDSEPSTLEKRATDIYFYFCGTQNGQKGMSKEKYKEMLKEMVAQGHLTTAYGKKWLEDDINVLEAKIKAEKDLCPDCGKPIAECDCTPF